MEITSSVSLAIDDYKLELLEIKRERAYVCRIESGPLRSELRFPVVEEGKERGQGQEQGQTTVMVDVERVFGEFYEIAGSGVLRVISLFSSILDLFATLGTHLVIRLAKVSAQLKILPTLKASLYELAVGQFLILRRLRGGIGPLFLFRQIFQDDVRMFSEIVEKNTKRGNEHQLRQALLKFDQRGFPQSPAAALPDSIRVTNVVLPATPLFVGVANALQSLPPKVCLAYCLDPLAPDARKFAQSAAGGGGLRLDAVSVVNGINSVESGSSITQDEKSRLVSFAECIGVPAEFIEDRFLSFDIDYIRRFSPQLAERKYGKSVAEIERDAALHLVVLNEFAAKSGDADAPLFFLRPEVNKDQRARIVLMGIICNAFSLNPLKLSRFQTLRRIRGLSGSEGAGPATRNWQIRCIISGDITEQPPWQALPPRLALPAQVPPATGFFIVEPERITHSRNDMFSLFWLSLFLSLFRPAAINNACEAALFSEPYCDEIGKRAGQQESVAAAVDGIINEGEVMAKLDCLFAAYFGGTRLNLENLHAVIPLHNVNVFVVSDFGVQSAAGRCPRCTVTIRNSNGRFSLPITSGI